MAGFGSLAPDDWRDAEASQALALQQADEAEAASKNRSWGDTARDILKAPARMFGALASAPASAEADQAAMMPETFANPLVTNLLGGAGAAVKSGATLPGDVAAGRVPMVGPDGHTSPELIHRAFDTASMAGGGSVAGALSEDAAKAGAPAAIAARPQLDWTPGGGSKTAEIGKTSIDYGISRDGKTGEVIMVKTPKADRGQGSARAAMEQMTGEADQRGTTLFLNSDPMDKGVSKPRLDAFYKSLGFVKNMGRNKDFSSRAEFVRPAKLLEDSASSGAPVAAAAEFDQHAPLDWIKAYHGSPHDFDQFDLSKIGTGEGAQAYGHGLYFAENPEVAEGYKKSISRNPEHLTAIAKFHGLTGDAAEMLSQQFASNFGGKHFNDWLDDIKGAADDPLLSQRVRSAAKEISEKSVEASDAYAKMKSAGHMYEVGIGAHPDHFLDWDKPLSEQHPVAREVLEKLIGKPPGTSRYLDDTLLAAPTKSGGQEYKAHVGRIYNEMSRGNSADFSRTLKESGVPGIKYLDGGSRASGDGTRNYVVFNHDLVKIARKYVAPGAVGVGGFGSLASSSDQE